VPRAAGRWLVGQLAALHSPQDVQICILTDSTGQAAWQWARWLRTAVRLRGRAAPR
jgi:S-DNA-T family DNA segregation ATPase FtsK/SpoIIIE